MSPTLPWIEHGYTLFAREGPPGLKVERLARRVGKSKSSFYHHFADLEVFTGQLLTHHLAQAQVMAAKEAACQSRAELIEVIVMHGQDLLFNRQLRIHRTNAAFATCFAETNRLTGQAILPVWAQILGLGEQTHLASMVLQLSLENFFLQITPETLNQDWLEGYFDELQRMVRAFQRTGQFPGLDDSV